MNKIIPSMVLRDGQIRSLSQLSVEDRKVLNEHSKSIDMMYNRPLLRKYLNECELRIVKLYEGFTEAEYNKINEFANKNGLKIQPNTKDFVPSSSHFSCIYLSSKDLVKDFLEEKGIWDAFQNNVKDIQKNKRLEKMLGEWILTPFKPRVKIIPDLKDYNDQHTHEGAIIVSKEFAEKCNKAWEAEFMMYAKEVQIKIGSPYKIINGSKTSFILKSLILISPNIKGYDILIPQSENKLKLNEEQISKNFAINPSISSETSFSRLLFRDKEKKKRNRLPKICIDTMFLCNAPEYTKKLKFYRDIYEEKIKGKIVADALFSYYDSTVGLMKYNKLGEKIIKGESIHSDEIWPEANKVLVKAIHKAIKPTVNGFYGQVMSMKFLPQFQKLGYRVETYSDGALIRYPSTVPIRCTVKLCNNILFVDELLWAKVLNGDIDGDQGFYLRSKTLPILFDWNKEEDVQELLKLCQFDSVEKGKKRVKIDMVKSQWEQAESQKNIGNIYNRNKAVMIAYLYAGVDPKIVTKMDMFNCSTLVQQAIDSLKYDVSDQVTRNEVTINYLINYCEQNKDKFGISELPKLNDIQISKAKRFLGAAKSTYNLDRIIKVAQEADKNSKVIYERILSYFKDWKYDEKNNK